MNENSRERGLKRPANHWRRLVPILALAGIGPAIVPAGAQDFENRPSSRRTAQRVVEPAAEAPALLIERLPPVNDAPYVWRDAASLMPGEFPFPLPAAPIMDQAMPGPAGSFRLAGYSEATTQPEDGGSSPDNATAGGPASSDAKTDATEKIGPAPVNNSQQFLRRQTVLLRPGQHQFDIGVSYAQYTNDYPVGLVNVPSGPLVGVVREVLHQRVVFIPTELRYGLTERTQGFFDLAVGYANANVVYATTQTNSNLGGLGDIRAGLSTRVREGCGYCPDIVATYGFTAPTGNPGNPLLTGLSPGNRLGEGFWSLFGNLLFVHVYDPVTIFYGVGYRHRFANEIAGNYFTPGEEFNYQCGVGFAVNPSVTLSGSFAGAYISQWQLNNAPLVGSVLEPQRMRFSVTVVKPRRIVEPFAEIGMTPAAPSSRIGITWTF